MKSIEIGGNKTALQKHSDELFTVVRSHNSVEYWEVKFYSYSDANEYWEKFV